MPDKELFARTVAQSGLFFRYGLTEAGPMVTRLHAADMLDPSVDGSIGNEYLFSEARSAGSGWPTGCQRGSWVKSASAVRA